MQLLTARVWEPGTPREYDAKPVNEANRTEQVLEIESE